MAPRKILWTPASMAAAVSAVEEGILSIHTAAQIHQIPRRTLRDYLKRSKLNLPFPCQMREKVTENEVIDQKEIEEAVITITVENMDTDTSWFNVKVPWYCYACKMDKVADMRQCNKCYKWYHEVCVGLTPDDLDPFECPIGC